MSLRKKIILLIVPIIVTPMIFSGWVSYDQLKATTIEKSQDQMETLLQQYALYADSLIHNSESNAQLFSNNEMLRRYMVTPSEEERYEVLQPLLMKQFQNYQQAYPDYYEFRLIFPGGFEDLRLVNRSIDNLTMDEANTHFITELLKVKEGTYSRIMRNPDNDELALYTATALILKDRSIEANSSVPIFRGYLVLTIDISELIRQMELSELGSDGFVFIANNQGIAELFPKRFEAVINGSRINQGKIEALEAVSVITDVVGGGVNLSSMPIIETDFLGQQGYMKAIKIHDNFILVTWLPTTEILDKTQELAAIVIAMTLLTIVITILLLFSSLNYFVLSPIQQLRSAATEIGKGVLNKKLQMKQNDEIGDLAYSFDEMRKRMLSSREHLERLVDNRTLELSQALKVAEKSSQEKSNFLSRMSHELRTPLNAIIGFSQLFGYDSNLTDHQKTNVNEINDAGEHLLSLIDEVLDLSKIESGSLEVSLESISLEKVLSNCCVMIEPLAKANDITIKLEHEQFKDLYVLADYIRTKQVILNLLSNAVKYNQEYGSVELYCTRSDNDFVRINVKDTGPGISEKDITQLYEPFNRLGAEYSEKEGTGIGLMITRQLVEIMGGEIGVTSTPGLGSVFWIELKTSDVKESSSGIEYKDEILQTDNYTEVTNTDIRILVAEDNKTNQEVFRQQLGRLGYDADFVDDGLEAFESWESGDYQLLLTDIHMPKVDGFELVDKIRNTSKYTNSDIIIIAITADAMEGQAQQCIDAGMDDYIAKPVHMDELKRKINKWLIKHSVDDEKENTPIKETPQAEHSEQSSDGQMRILVAEDNIMNQELLDEQLNMLGYEADYSNDGLEAFERCLSGDYDILLTDIQMPKMDGFELASKIRDTKQFADGKLKIIALTGDAQKGEEQRFKRLGMDDYIAKPVFMDDLQKKLEQWSPKTSSYDSTENNQTTDQSNDAAQQSNIDTPISIPALHKVVGKDTDNIKRLLNRFVITASEDLTAIQTAYTDKDTKELQSQAHKLRGSALSTGAIQLGETCKKLQTAATNQQWKEIETLVPMIDISYQAVQHFVEENYS